MNVTQPLSIPAGAITTTMLADNAVTLAKMAAESRAMFLRGMQAASPNINLAQSPGHQYPQGFIAVQALNSSLQFRRWTARESWQLGVCTFTLTQESLGALDTFTVGVAKNGSVLGSVTFNDGDAVELEKTVDLSAHSLASTDNLTVSYSQSNAIAQDNRWRWNIPLTRLP